jgi:ABC-type phosphate transport system permease subunit
MSIWWFLLMLLAFVLALGTIIDVVGQRYGGWKTAGWVVAVLVVPLVASVIYWILRTTSRSEVEQARLAQAELRREAERRPLG